MVCHILYDIPYDIPHSIPHGIPFWLKVIPVKGFSSIRLMTNNLNKVDRLKDQGLNVVERVPLIVHRNQHNDVYLQTKLEKSGHIL